MPPRM
jgi:hypothetical protein